MKNKLKAFMFILFATTLFIPTNPLITHAEGEETLFSISTHCILDDKLMDEVTVLEGKVVTDNSYKYLLTDNGSLDETNISDGVYDLAGEIIEKGKKIDDISTTNKNTDIKINREFDYLYIFKDDNTLMSKVSMKDIKKWCDVSNAKFDDTVIVKQQSSNSTSVVYKLNVNEPYSGATLTDGASYYNIDYRNNEVSVNSNGTYSVIVDYEVGYSKTVPDVVSVGNVIAEYNTYADTMKKEFSEELDNQQQKLNPKVTLSKIPSKKCKSFKLTISSDKKGVIWCNGISKEAVKTLTIAITNNGTYTYSVSTDKGGFTEGTFEVKCIKGNDDEYDNLNKDWENASWTSTKDTTNNLVQTGIYDNYKIIGLIIMLCGLSVIIVRRLLYASKKNN